MSSYESSVLPQLILCLLQQFLDLLLFALRGPLPCPRGGPPYYNRTTPMLPEGGEGRAGGEQGGVLQCLLRQLLGLLLFARHGPPFRPPAMVYLIVAKLRCCTQKEKNKEVFACVFSYVSSNGSPISFSSSCFPSPLLLSML